RAPLTPPPPLSLHDALPISRPAPVQPRGSAAARVHRLARPAAGRGRAVLVFRGGTGPLRGARRAAFPRLFGVRARSARRRLARRSEEHTSELQSQSNLVCRL